MKFVRYFLVGLFLICSLAVQAANCVSGTYVTTPGAGSCTYPIGVTSAEIDIGGGAGSGGSGRHQSTNGGTGGGGGSGSYSQKTSIVVVGGVTVVNYNVGPGGAAQTIENTNGNSGTQTTASITSPLVSMTAPAGSGGQDGHAGDTCGGAGGGTPTGGTTNTPGNTGANGSDCFSPTPSNGQGANGVGISPGTGGIQGTSGVGGNPGQHGGNNIAGGGGGWGGDGTICTVCFQSGAGATGYFVTFFSGGSSTAEQDAIWFGATP